MRPVVGILPLVDEEKESLWMLPGYMDGIERAGGLPLMLPLTADLAEIQELVQICDGFLFTGGHDVSPELYGETPLQNLVSTCRLRDEMEQHLFRLALEKDKPMLGICRGIQFINVALGGSLYQDLPTQWKKDIDHHQTPPYDIPVHRDRIIEGSPLHKLLQKSEIDVNSYHHQAIKNLAETLEVMAISEDGLVEAVYKPDAKFLWAVQWHPEFSYKVDEDSCKIFEEFIQLMLQ